MSYFDRLHTLADRPRHACPKGVSRLQAKVAAKPVTQVTDAQFKKIVRTRDKLRCRRCGRKTVITLAHVPLRCEVHHIHGRLGVFRHEDRCALIVCSSCHEKVTGAVAEKVVVVGTKFVNIDGQPRIDARATVTFERVA